jgi:hypothetical protein
MGATLASLAGRGLGTRWEKRMDRRLPKLPSGRNVGSMGFTADGVRDEAFS